MDTMHYEPVTRTLEDGFGKNCFLNDNGISANNQCSISGFFNKCPAGSSLTYASEKNSVDAKLMCPLDSVAQSDWVEASQKGFCQCDAALLDEGCNVLEADMDCECFACPAGTKLGFAYTCTTPIVGPCKSFDCYGKCNGKYDPGNLVGDKQTFAPTDFPSPENNIETSSASNIGTPNDYVMGTAVMVVALFRTLM